MTAQDDLAAAVEAVVERAETVERTIGALADQFEEHHRLEGQARKERIQRDKRSSAHLVAFSKEIKAMRGEMQEMRGEVSVVKGDVSDMKDMLGAWRAVQVVGRFIKWLGAIVAGIAAIWVSAKLGIVAIFYGGHQ